GGGAQALREAVPVGPEHSPVGSERWTDGRRRGRKGTGEGGGGSWAPPRAPFPLGWRGGRCGAVRFAGVESNRGSPGPARQSPDQEGARDLAGWVPWMYIWMSLAQRSPGSTSVGWRGRWCGSLRSTHSIYIPTR